MTAEEPGARRASIVVLGVGLTAFVALAAALIPWHPYRGAPLDLPAATEVFTRAELSAMESYSSFARFWSRTGLAVSIVVACVLGFSSWGRKLMAVTRGPWWLRVIEGVTALQVIGSVATLAPDLMIRRRRLDVGLSTQAWSGFVTDRVTSLALSIVGTTVVVLVVMACARRWRRLWPAVAGVLMAALVLVTSFIYPVLVQPLFTNVTSLPEGSLRTEIHALADQQGVQLDDILVADASRRTTTLNAYVAGFGSTRRVVLYDNLVEGVPRDQTLSVVSHELAHAEYDDVLVGSLLGAAAALVVAGLLGLVAGRMAKPRRGSGEGITIGSPMAVPFLLALLAVGSVLALPIQNTISRQVETRADVTALETTKDGAAFRELQRSLATRSLSDPSPAAWSHFWFGSHPTTLQRIALADRIAGDGPAR